ncbi:FAD/NAD(P)-binding protein [Pseudomonas sp. 10B1]|uniref:FAD/NAD(P)-binding protein n=1 Tax=unclassified Pseudomonas TaxID=196821 RepID=UPI002B233D38|nr:MULTISPECIES: FAD/NAD(P)-binding protein [unclassified Pseudomonas]MEA9997080.1 FAD/NAD(P)-binding protein [Pseudomonas sp. AA4]MEB0087722.1 FAD/NAD(P)-binding protein [Pseudomonas sp. RTI1]MEB0124844.1 FAD/NAD(P)-binding protein [Pseudomonas sp. CCC1.2]MEB0155743.1 FAD/NAD(P)-binding protein [Pseudomonas sp. CCC4.3]MEB0217783.1 FAD/NAD(P)-binding protein [Pseudomonas sp. AB12(2023)]
MKTKTIAIIGAGFCGSTLAVHLLRRPPVTPLRIILINGSGTMARGVAYGTRTAAHVLNVPAGRMSALAGEEDSFDAYAKRCDPSVVPGSFVERRLYGDYLEALLNDAADKAPPGCELNRVIGEVVQVVPCEDGEGARLLMNNGEHLDADRVVLSVGNYARQQPSIAPEQRSFYEDPRYVHNPWRPGALSDIGADDPVLLIGSGLTMVDVVLVLRDRGHRGPIQAISRRGLIPQPHRELNAQPAYDKRLPHRMLTNCSVRHYVRAVRDSVEQHARTGGDWRDVIGGLRSATVQLWHALPTHERRRFLRHVRPYWDVHRHRCAPQPGARLQAEIERGGLTLLAARVVGYDPKADDVGVYLRRRGARTDERLDIAAVINCTTPALDLRHLADPLLSSLRTDGLLVPDVLGIGLEVDHLGALIDCKGVASGWLYYVGPLLQGRDWEATAVPELRGYVERLADVLQSL